MKIKNTILLAFSVVAAITAAVACRHTPSSLIPKPTSHFSTARSTPQLVLSVNFGTPPTGGGICLGKGICDAVIAQGKAVTAVADTFQVSPNDSNILTMRFSMLNLEKVQPDQVAYFTDTTGTYPFDSTYSLTSSIYKSLNLLPNAKIDGTCQNSVTINGDQVIVSYYYIHN